MVVVLDDDVLLFVVHRIELKDVDVVVLGVVGVVEGESASTQSDVVSTSAGCDLEFWQRFPKIFVLVWLSPPSGHGVSSGVMFVVVRVLVFCGVGLYATSWLLCKVVSSSRQKVAGSMTLIKLQAWCHLCGSL